MCWFKQDIVVQTFVVITQFLASILHAVCLFFDRREGAATEGVNNKLHVLVQTRHRCSNNLLQQSVDFLLLHYMLFLFVLLKKGRGSNGKGRQQAACVGSNKKSLFKLSFVAISQFRASILHVVFVCSLKEGKG